MQLISSTTQVCAVIGNPVEHSLSPPMHNAAFQTMKLNFVYLAFRVEDVAGCLAGVRAMDGFRGLSVTIPHKSAVMEHLDKVDPMAQHVGSVNTVVRENGQLLGYTTDGSGAVRAFEDAGVSLERKRVLLLGSGGAIRAVAFALIEQAHVGKLTILGRTPDRVRELAEDVAQRTGVEVYSGVLSEALVDALGAHQVIIQGTPMGMHPDNTQKSLIPKRLLRPHHIVFDMVYRPMRTRLIQDAQEVGCQTILGLEMLLNQAAIQFEIWTGKPAPRHVMRQALLHALKEPLS